MGRGTDSAYSPLKVSYRRFSFPRDRPDVWKTKSANRDFFFVLHTPALSGPPPCISTSCSFFKKLGVCCPSQKNIVIYSHISLYTVQVLPEALGVTKLQLRDLYNFLSLRLLLPFFFNAIELNFFYSVKKKRKRSAQKQKFV